MGSSCFSEARAQSNSNQVPSARGTVASRSTDNGPAFLPPVHIPPANPMRIKRDDLSNSSQSMAAQTMAAPAESSNQTSNEAAVRQRESRSILRQVAHQEPIGTGVQSNNESSLRQTGFDPFAEVVQEFDRVSQTPAPPHTRPRDQFSGQPAAPVSVMRGVNQQPDTSANEAWGSSSGTPSTLLDQGEPLPAIDEHTSAPRRSLINYSTPQDDDQDAPMRRKSEKDCDEFRQQLLGQSLTDISLDISPPRRPTALKLDTETRDWTDRLGNVLATGVMVNMVRGYVVIETTTGALVRLPFARLSGADLQAIAAAWQIPEECIVSTGMYPDRFWSCQTVTWHASNLCHKPLYFENVNLERYGHSAGPLMQPLRSTGHFFVSLLTLPYHTAINPPNECIYALGYYRPGNCAPWLVDPFPISLAGAARQATMTTGAWYILP